MEGKKRQASRRKYHYIYKTTCIITNRFYIGMHSTDNLDDGYQGSGKRLWYSINKYGRENHITEILEFLPDRNSLNAREKEIVNEELIGEELCMNLALGGAGGFISNEIQFNRSSAGGKARSKKMEKDVEYRKKIGKKLSDSVKKSYEKRSKNWGLDWTGRTHSEETKRKMSKSSKGIGSRSKNSQYGTCWITNGFENKKIKKGDLIPSGWKLGRKIK